MPGTPNPARPHGQARRIPGPAGQRRQGRECGLSGGGDSFALWAGKANAFMGSVRLGGEPPSRGRTAPLGLGGGS